VLWAVWTTAVCPAPSVWCGVERTGCCSSGVLAGGGQRWGTGVRCTAVPSYPQSCPQMWVDLGFGVEPTGERVVFDGKYVTAAGVSAGG
jgi:hypothetical protein